MRGTSRYDELVRRLRDAARPGRDAPEQMNAYLEKVRLHAYPAELTPDDANATRDAGVSDDALVDAIHVAALFNMIVRLADSLGWDVPAFEEFGARADAMLRTGYALD